MRKVIVSILLACSLLITAAAPAFALDEGSISAPSAILMEARTGKILFEKNAHENRPCASITKVMTLLLVFEAMDSGRLSLDDTITSSAHAASMGGSDIWLEEGESMTADDMIKATVVASANDAAVALAEHISGSEDAFVEQMNARATIIRQSGSTISETAKPRSSTPTSCSRPTRALRDSKQAPPTTRAAAWRLRHSVTE